MPLKFTPAKAEPTVALQIDGRGASAPAPNAALPGDGSIAGAVATPKTEATAPSTNGWQGSGRSLVHLATRIFNCALAIRPDKGDVILSVLGPRLGLAAECIPVVSLGDDPGGDELGYSVQNHIAQISVHGTLVKRSSGMDALSGLTSYEELAGKIKNAMADDNVKGVIFDVDSPGGESSGMYDLADYIYSLRGKKPMYAVSNDSMYSAAYAIGSCADQLYVTREGGMGSIGCYMLFCDQSGFDKQKGLKYDYIHSFSKKVDANPHSPLDKDARSELQAEVDRQCSMFVMLAARNRNCTAQQIMDLQSACVYGGGCIPLLADRLGGVASAMADMMAKLGIDPDEDCDPAIDPNCPDEDELGLAAAAPTAPVAVFDGGTGSVQIHQLGGQAAPNNQIPNLTTGVFDVSTATFSAAGVTFPQLTQEQLEAWRNATRINAGAIPPHKTATSTAAWDGPTNEARLKNDQTSAYYRKAYAWQEAGSDGTKKAQFKYPHHFVSAGGDIGAASTQGCQSGIANLNGARSAPKIPSSDRKGIYDHLAKHLRDAGVEPAPLKSEAEVATEMQSELFVAGAVASAFGAFGAGGPGYADMECSTELSERLFGKPDAILAVRALPGCLASSDTKTAGRKISLLVVPYDGSTCSIGGFKECYQRGAFAEGLDNDPRVLFNHDEACILGRKSAGTAEFWEDAQGVHAEADAPDTSWANDLLVSMERGDITQASAAFWILQHRWEMRGQDKVRIIEKALMREASVHAFAAYENTQASVLPADKLAAAASYGSSVELLGAKLRLLKLR